MPEITFTRDEKYYLLRALEYFKREEEREIAELSLPNGNSAFIPSCEERREIYASLVEKCQTVEVKDS